MVDHDLSYRGPSFLARQAELGAAPDIRKATTALSWLSPSWALEPSAPTRYFPAWVRVEPREGVRCPFSAGAGRDCRGLGLHGGQAPGWTCCSGHQSAEP